MQRVINQVIELLKWPAALFMLVSLPALFQSLAWFKFMQLKYFAMFGGFFIYFISKSMSDASLKSNMQILAHELTHAFFALLTFHKVKSIKLAEDDSGGSMSFEGEGNWLIVVAPYFFPLFAFFLMLFVPLLGHFIPALLINAIIGYLLAYHLDTVASQIHDKQTDFAKVSAKFCWMFLPGANLWVIGFLLAFNSKQWLGVQQYQKLVFWLMDKNWQYVKNLIF